MFCNSSKFQKQGCSILIIPIAGLMLAACVPAVFAEEKPDESSGWHFQVAPYLWMVALNGDVTVKGQESDPDLSFSDIWDELNIAATLTFDARKGKWGFLGDVIVANLGKSTRGEGIKIDPTIKQTLLTAGVSYRLGTWNFSETTGKDLPAVTVEGLFGVRYTHLDVELDFKNAPLPDASGDKDWFDPLIGARAFIDLSDRWALAITGNVGGFGLGSDFTWEAMGTIGYRFRLFSEKNNARFAAGYRAIYQDYSERSGSDRFEWEVTLHGPIVGLVISF
jgi:hypothetical protein